MQWKPLNVITFRERETDNINSMITMGSNKIFYLYPYNTYLIVIWVDLIVIAYDNIISDHIKRLPLFYQNTNSQLTAWSTNLF